MRTQRTSLLLLLFVGAVLGIGAVSAYKPQCRNAEGKLIQCSGALDNTQAPAAIAASTLTGSIDVARLPSAVQNANDLTSGAQAQLDALSAQVALVSGAAQTFYLQEPASDIGGGYETLRTQPSTAAEDFDQVSVTAATSPLLMDPYASEAGIPGINAWPAGNWIFHIHGTVDSNTGVTQLLARVYSRTTGGTETLLFSATSPEMDTGTTEYQWQSAQSAFELAQTDRLIVKIYATTTSAGSRTVRIYYQGSAQTSYIATPIPSPLAVSGAANQVLATPNGSNGAVVLRQIVNGDITAGTIAETALDTATQYKLPPTGVSNGRLIYDNGTRASALPFVASAILTTNASALSYVNTLPATMGGTGIASFTSAGELLYSNSTTGLSSLLAGTSGYLLKSNGTAAPSWLSTLPVANGGTGQTAALVAGGLLYGASAAAQGVTAAGTAGQLAASGGTGAPTWTAAPIGIISTGFRGSTTGSNTYYFTGQNIAPSTGGDQVFYQAPRAVTLKNCACYASFAGSGTGTCTLRKWNGATWADTALTCTMTLPDYRCQDTTHSASFAASDLASGDAVTAGVTLNVDTEANFTCEVYAQ